MKLRHSILAACASTAIAGPASPADNNPLAIRALTCVEMGGSYTSASTNTKFTVACKSTPVDSVPLSYIQALSFDACLDACAGLPACAAATYVSMFRNCNFYSSVGGGVRAAELGIIIAAVCVDGRHAAQSTKDSIKDSRTQSKTHGPSQRHTDPVKDQRLKDPIKETPRS